MYSLSLSAAGIRFLGSPTTAGGFYLPCGRLTALRETPSGLPRSAFRRNSRGGHLLYTGDLVLAADQEPNLLQLSQCRRINQDFDDRQ
jgi:hypothetical protein